MATRRKSSSRKKSGRKPARKKAPRKKAVRKKGSARKKAARKKAARKKTTPKKSSRKKAARKQTSSKKSPARKKAPRRKVAARKAPAQSRRTPGRRASDAAQAARSRLVELARKIVKATEDASHMDWSELYAPGATSREASGDPVVGHEGLQAKLDQWNTIQDSTRSRWTPRAITLGNDTICIEWDAKIQMRDGRVVDFPEVAVHQVQDGRIVSERYYYNPMALAPPPAEPSEPG
jgi:ketosteroid isomerase-like protein